MENSMEVSQKLRIELPYFTPVLLSIQRIEKNINWKVNMHPYIHCSIFLNKNHDLEATCLSMDKNIKVLCSLSLSIYISVQFSHSVMSDSLQCHGMQHASLPCPSPTLRAWVNSCPLSILEYHLTIKRMKS